MKPDALGTAPSTLVQRAVAAGLLPSDALEAASEQRPWSVLLMTALGAWLSAVPLFLLTYQLLGDSLTQGSGPYWVGALMLAAAVTVLRSTSAPLFVEQLALPALLLAGATLALGLYRDLHESLASSLLMLAALVLAGAVAKAWLRVLLGAAALLCFGLALQPASSYFGDSVALSWLTLHLALLIWLLAMLWQQRHGLQGRHAGAAALLEALAAGWLPMLILGLAVISGSSRGLWASTLPHESWGLAAASVAGALLGYGLAAHAWPDLRRALPLAVALVLAALCAWLSTLGGVLLALAFTATTQRWRLSATCAIAAVWVLAASYYQLSWSLTEKALVLLGAAALLALAAAIAARRHGAALCAEASAPVRVKTMPAAAWLLGGGLLALLVVNVGIWQKQRLIAEGRPLFVALAPVDPRSLMQGDFMRLNYDLGTDVDAANLPRLGARRPLLVLRIDPSGVAQAVRLQAPGAPLAANEQLIELSPRNGGWTLVSDAWFFREGDGLRWQQAKYGEFRVRADGQALLVGLAAADLQRIAP
ncbi:MAG: GDYXXLXY domain-containing protein [Paucibacter sp.]|nr:GDYXXLXY domain-containing protein [Roseateles sp.]